MKKTREVDQEAAKLLKDKKRRKNVESTGRPPNNEKMCVENKRLFKIY